MKPIIGITANYSYEEEVGTKIHIGVKGQQWQVLADDYIRAIEFAGGTPIIIPITKNIDSLLPVLSILDGIIFSGGSDIDPQCYGELPKFGLGQMDPLRDQHEIQLAQKVLYEMEIPVLAVCRGCQLINVADGGTLYQHLQHEKREAINHSPQSPKYHATHPVNIKTDSKLHSIFNKHKVHVNSFHHQGIKKIGKNFDATVTAPDELVEGIEMRGERFVVGVQWHPEMMIDQQLESKTLFEVFVQTCKQRVN
ncbi:gamma-glutamyl-gamma-aminobutyrate hydrolase family protein [Shimazuella sp. AN120528]|uniref:gamma-glutamyl-gamma-aminobutyrate hydrolase family protein n=1 Tax=Shimazuella soli TaxID=1892854 RepID=UPI001F10A8C7|nr:gamma-glutamyl-gamma-aminobutyrate hydrolase family protein [Shimazuella soli]MCH5584065.1 gamma-glutamyl-gamma-aminobutyrate hydrolase family protein [Shimazuella soli]